KTPDGFLSLRDGPGMRFKVLEKLRQGDVLYIDTVECSTISGTMVCGNPKEWTHVNTVPRLDGPIREAKKFTQGWVANKYINGLSALNKHSWLACVGRRPRYP